MILKTEKDELRKIGLSERKVIYINTLAKAIITKEIVFEDFINLSNDEIIKRLTMLKGIGRWTAEMYLIFSLGRENVFSKGDGTIRRTIQWMYNLDELPSTEDLSKYFSSWNQYATIVSAYLWKSIALGLTQKKFDDIIEIEETRIHERM